MDSTTDSEAVQIVAVANVAPTVVVFGDASANEGDTKTYTYTVTIPGDDRNPTITESCGTGGVKDRYGGCQLVSIARLRMGRPLRRSK